LRLCRLPHHCVQGADHGFSAAVEHVGVDHGGGDLRVSQQILHRADVVAVLQQVGGKAVPKGVAAEYIMIYLFIRWLTACTDRDDAFNPNKTPIFPVGALRGV